VRVRWLIVDGYSLLHRDPQLAPSLDSNLQFARRQLIKKIERLGIAERTTVVFDGRGAGKSEEPCSIEVLFSPAHQTADTVIERLVHSEADTAGVMVITSDRAERETVTAAGAQSMSCANFLEWLSADDASTASKIKQQAKLGKNTLGDFFPR
jgi:predicted RNA-binding protein with PIN domain